MASLLMRSVLLLAGVLGAIVEISLSIERGMESEWSRNKVARWNGKDGENRLEALG
jgi:hypothetical protein